jgi:hypothetical protein
MKVRMEIYQGKYGQHGKKGYVDHLMEFAVKAKYLEPQMTSSEFLEAIRNHFSPHIQRLWSTAQLTNLQESITLLSEIETLEPYDERY